MFNHLIPKVNVPDMTHMDIDDKISWLKYQLYLPNSVQENTLITLDLSKHGATDWAEYRLHLNTKSLEYMDVIVQMLPEVMDLYVIEYEWSFYGRDCIKKIAGHAIDYASEDCELSSRFFEPYLSNVNWMAE
jgi:hypothetical protein